LTPVARTVTALPDGCILLPKIPICVSYGGPWHGRYWYIFYGHLEYFIVIWYILWPFVTFCVHWVIFLFDLFYPEKIWQLCTGRRKNETPLFPLMSLVLSYVSKHVALNRPLSWSFATYTFSTVRKEKKYVSKRRGM
jgi:hypothetical protein